MDINTLYSVKIAGYNNIFKESVRIYRDTVDFLIPVCMNHWDEISRQADLQHKKMYVEHLVHKTDMRPDGTVLGRYFYKAPKEYDCLKHKIDHIKRAQRHGSRCVKNLWRYADGINHDISVKTASFIEGIARMYDADVIVFEHLDTSGKKHGSKKQKLALWRKMEVQRIAADKAHRLGMHIAHICAWGTSRLAYDGSGTVLRGDKSTRTNGTYSICEFKSGKVYNCDLNASYNIGSRYFVREILKSLPVTEGQRIQAKVPGCAKRSTCTLSTLINLNSALCA